jgi:hypothetical protein
MHPLLRLAFVWLLAFALPVQGIAGVGGLHCHDGMQGAAGSVRSTHGDAMHAHAPHDAALHAAAADAAAAEEVVAVDAAGGADAASSVDRTCSACAACCASCAIARSALRVAEPPAGRAAPPGAGAPPAVFVTDGPERPPRSTRD